MIDIGTLGESCSSELSLSGIQANCPEVELEDISTAEESLAWCEKKAPHIWGHGSVLCICLFHLYTCVSMYLFILGHNSISELIWLNNFVTVGATLILKPFYSQKFWTSFSNVYLKFLFGVDFLYWILLYQPTFVYLCRRIFMCGHFYSLLWTFFLTSAASLLPISDTRTFLVRSHPQPPFLRNYQLIRRTKISLSFTVFPSTYWNRILIFTQKVFKLDILALILILQSRKFWFYGV